MMLCIPDPTTNTLCFFTSVMTLNGAKWICCREQEQHEISTLLVKGFQVLPTGDLLPANLKHSILEFYLTVLGTTWPSCLWAITPSYLGGHFHIGWDSCQVEVSFALNTSQSFESEVLHTNRTTMKTHWRQQARRLRLCSTILKRHGKHTLRVTLLQ